MNVVVNVVTFVLAPRHVRVGRSIIGGWAPRVKIVVSARCKVGLNEG